MDDLFKLLVTAFWDFDRSLQEIKSNPIGLENLFYVSAVVDTALLKKGIEINSGEDLARYQARVLILALGHQQMVEIPQPYTKLAYPLFTKLYSKSKTSQDKDGPDREGPGISDGIFFSTPSLGERFNQPSQHDQVIALMALDELVKGHDDS